jgi:hypothetical protein
MVKVHQKVEISEAACGNPIPHAAPDHPGVPGIKKTIIDIRALPTR